jgi:RNA polymerase sigma factor (sigma-70 family)
VKITTDFVRQYKRMVDAECAKVTTESDLIEDLAQNAWLEICKSAETFDESKPVGPWVTTLAQRACYNYLRNNVYEQPDTVLDSTLTPVLDGEVSDGSWIEQMIPSQDTAEDAQLLGELMFRAASLSEQEAAVFNLVYWHGVAYAEVAKKFGIEEVTVRNITLRIRQKIETKELYHKAFTYHSGGPMWADWAFMPNGPANRRMGDTPCVSRPDLVENYNNDSKTSDWYGSAS